MEKERREDERYKRCKQKYKMLCERRKREENLNGRRQLRK